MKAICRNCGVEFSFNHDDDDFFVYGDCTEDKERKYKNEYYCEKCFSHHPCYHGNDKTLYIIIIFSILIITLFVFR